MDKEVLAQILFRNTPTTIRFWLPIRMRLGFWKPPEIIGWLNLSQVMMIYLKLIRLLKMIWMAIFENVLNLHFNIEINVSLSCKRLGVCKTPESAWVMIYLKVIERLKMISIAIFEGVLDLHFNMGVETNVRAWVRDLKLRVPLIR